MSRKIKTLVITLGVLVLLGGGYYGSTVWQKKKSETPSAPYTPSPRLGYLEANKIVKMEIGDIVFEKTGNTWELVSLEGKKAPPGIVLDQSQIENLTWSFASFYIDRTLDEDSGDLSVYGLDKPSARAAITDSDGKRSGFILGDLTPSRSSYYIMEEGDPKVHIVSSYSGDNLLVTLDKFRQRSLFPAFEFQDLVMLQLGTPQNMVEIRPKPEEVPVYLSTSFSLFFITSPYKLPRGIDGESLNELVQPLSGLSIVNFIDDDPSSLAPYGLDKPFGIHLVTQEASLDLLIGNRFEEGSYYAKLPDTPGVFSLTGLDPLINVKPFALLDKFALLVNIDSVDSLLVTGGAETLNAEFRGKGDDGVYFLNGKRTDPKSFKTWYQAVIGLLADAECPEDLDPNGPWRKAPPPIWSSERSDEITVEYQLNTPPGERAVITLIPYNRDFYVLLQEGTIEFLVSRNQVRNIYDSADKMVYVE